MSTFISSPKSLPVHRLLMRGALYLSPAKLIAYQSELKEWMDNGGAAYEADLKNWKAAAAGQPSPQKPEPAIPMPVAPARPGGKQDSSTIRP